MPEVPVSQWVIELVVTETMPYVEESRKAIIADRLMTSMPHANVRVKRIDLLKADDSA
jgi:hypothetical protein